MKKTSPPPPPPWIAPLHGVIVLLCVAVVLLAATFQHVVITGYGPQGRFYIVPSIVGLLFGVLLVAVRRIVVVNAAFGRLLAERNESIEKLNRDLEKRVAERTAELTAKHEQLLQAQRLEMVGKLAGGVAHDLNNMLMVIRGNIDLITGDDNADMVSDVAAAAEQAKRLVNSLVTTASHSSTSTTLPLDELVDALVGLLSRAFGARYTIDVEHQADHAPRVDAVRVEQILLNLLVNARDAQPEGGHMLVRSGITDKGNVVLEVQDEGPGIPEAIREQVFDPFFTTKPDGQASGLGLSTVRLLVQEMGGEISLQPGLEGAAFRIELPPVGRVSK